MSALENEDSVPRTGWPQSATGAAEPAHTGTRKPPMDEAAFREKVKTMGKTSKRKFAQMASMFSARGRMGGGKGAKLLGHAPAPSKDNLLLDAEPLVNDDSDEDDHTKSTKTPTKGKYTSFS